MMTIRIIAAICGVALLAVALWGLPWPKRQTAHLDPAAAQTTRTIVQGYQTYAGVTTESENVFLGCWAGVHSSGPEERAATERFCKDKK